MPNYKSGVIGGVLLSFPYSLSLGEIYKTILLATVGAIVSFLMSYFLNIFFKRNKKSN